MRELTLKDFAGHLGESHTVKAGGASFPLRLEQAQDLPGSGRAGGSFRLEFRGPFEPVLPQAIYEFRRGGEAFEIFIVAIGRDAEGTRYEAIFF